MCVHVCVYVCVCTRAHTPDPESPAVASLVILNVTKFIFVNKSIKHRYSHQEILEKEGEDEQIL